MTTEAPKGPTLGSFRPKFRTDRPACAPAKPDPALRELARLRRSLTTLGLLCWLSIVVGLVAQWLTPPIPASVRMEIVPILEEESIPDGPSKPTPPPTGGSIPPRRKLVG